jgi:hypothetical protein
MDVCTSAMAMLKLLRNIIRFLRPSAEAASNAPDAPESAEVWCLVGNVVDEHPHGENKDIRRGAKHFSAGTKVYCLTTQWGDGYDKAVVVGIHRGSRKWVTVVMPTSQITNWRAKAVYKPAVLKRLRDGFRNRPDGQRLYRQWNSKAEVEGWVRHLRRKVGRP